MLIILTEDTTSGYQFLNSVLRDILKSRIKFKVISSGGYTKLYSEFKRILKEGLMTGDKLLLCYDKFGVYNKHRREDEQNIVKLYTQVKNIRDDCKKHSIQIEEMDWYCFEELFICFNKLDTIVNGLSKDFKQLISMAANEQELYKRYKIYKKYFKAKDNGKYKSTTIEGMIGEELALQTSYNQLLKIDKDANVKLGVCWTSKICSQEKFRHSKCKNCRIRDNYNFITLWKYIYRNDLILQELIRKII